MIFKPICIISIIRGTPIREWFQEACQKYIFMRWKGSCYTFFRSLHESFFRDA